MDENIMNCNIMIDSESFFDQPISSNSETYENIRKISTGQGDNFGTGFLFHWSYFMEQYRIVAIDLSEQQVLDADKIAIQQIKYTGDLEQNGAGAGRNDFGLDMHLIYE